MAVEVRRFALKYNPPTLIVEYRKCNEDSGKVDEKPSTFTKKIRIKKLAHDDPNIEELANQLINTYPKVLGEDKVKRPQILALLAKLVAGRDSRPQLKPPLQPELNLNVDDDFDIDTLLDDTETKDDLPMLPPPAISPSVPATGTMFFGKKSRGPLDPSWNDPNRSDGPRETDMKAVIDSTDLSRCSDEMNMKAKVYMSQEFEVNRLKPGDTGFVWDKEVEFEGPTEATDWDSD